MLRRAETHNITASFPSRKIAGRRRKRRQKSRVVMPKKSPRKQMS